ncbi:MAG: ABC transporter ATP-binding protein, partial [Lachnospiraceae bacterium]|nr:ABC transporter ATP-binding protein [Lachnospiraceae bacterium]
MVKTLLKQVKEFKRDSLMTPCFMILEVLMEVLIPLLMGSIINDGIEKGNIQHIYLMGAAMLVAAVIGLFAGAMGGKYGARAATGFAKNLREAMFTKIQTFSFANIDKFSTAGLVTRLTTDVSNLQNAYQMILRMCIRAPFSLVIAMIAAYFVSPRIASIYLYAVLILGLVLATIMKFAMKYFSQLFEKYDALNESTQENVTASRVVKAYVREDYEIKKFQKASGDV